MQSFILFSVIFWTIILILIKCRYVLGGKTILKPKAIIFITMFFVIAVYIGLYISTKKYE